MGASRKLQGEIDRVLKKVQEGVDVFDSIWNKVYDTDNANQKEKFEADLKKEIKKLQRYRDQIKTWIQSSEIKDKKVSASYEQALVDARKLIEREMERFKICEKETKTKAFSKEGLGQQPKTDPKEKAKSETRDWLNNVVGELESQIDNFEAEMEGLSVKKGKARPPRLTHLETSISRHKAHVMKLELILRLLDNDELSAEHVNDVKDFLEDYLERNQEDFDEFSDVDELYNTLPLDKVEALEDLVSMGQPGLAKGMKSQGGGAASSVLSLKTSSNTSSSLSSATVTSSQLTVPIPEQDETNSQDSNSDTVPKTPPSKTSILSSSNPSNPPTIQTPIPTSSTLLPASPSVTASVSGPVSGRGILEGAIPSSPLNPPIIGKEEDAVNFPGRRSSPALTDPAALTRGIGRGSIPSQPSVSVPLSSVGTAPSSGVTLGSVPLASEVTKRNILGSDERLASSVVSGRAFSSSVVPGMQWRPGSTFQTQSEGGQFRGRTEIAPDQREKFLQRLQQVQQQGHSNILGMPNLAGGNSKPFSGQQQNPLLQQLSSQSSSLSSQVGLGLGLQSPGLSTASSATVQQPIPIQQGVQQGSLVVSPKDSVTEDQQQQNLPEDSAVEIAPGSGLSKNLMNDDDLKASYVKDVPSGGTSGPLPESTQLSRDADLSPGQPLQSSQPSASLGVIGRRSVSDLGAIGDNIGGTANSGGVHDLVYNTQMLEAAYYKLPQPKDSERAKSYTPRHPAATPPSYPQVQAPIVNNPAFWERLGLDTLGTDTLFFAFYYQPNTYQQYLAAKELKKQSWRYHRKYYTWFQRHEEPKIATDDFEKGTYVYFDFHLANDDPNQGWCQRIKADFKFEYSFLEDELIV
ncbi:general negative regulator of transcription subunit 3-like isoform X2 [Chenopodium quinoa]|uniref:general negative regulator of transcription subunit 3-like isoform X2 n=1 Tax=Chenopodium quinoa TaxID=63459 RepID=UPI000B77D888|nr:general negative regulator of transcription subunit 3-like isoform X2 [Chenopodium quinoa]